uniref:Uncharacterized protein n=1 Tax=Parascaris univalens TaxID=6257 RepID=A0A915C6N6_PARUN
MFLVKLLVALALSTLSTASITIIEREVGHPLTLDLGNDVSLWARQLTGSTATQYISKCSTDKSSNETNCDQWTENGKIIGNRATVTSEGKLRIEELTKEDEGIYFSPEKKPRIYRTKTGYYSVAPNVFQVFTRPSKNIQSS